MSMPEDASVLETSPKRSWLRRLYHWTLSWADHPQARWALFFIALIEASVFPIPPDVLLLALALGRPEWGLRFAMLATLGSTLGAALGYAIGALLLFSVGIPVLEFFGVMSQFSHVQELFHQYGLALVWVAGFSPIPFKVVTIAAGAFGLAFWPFVLAALLSRGARFYLEGALMRWGGARLRAWIERYFEWMTLLVAVVVVLGFASIWWFR